MLLRVSSYSDILLYFSFSVDCMDWIQIIELHRRSHL